MIRDTKSSYNDESPKILISQPNLSFFCLMFLHVIRIALVYTIPVAFFSFDFFPASFCQNVDRAFLEIATISFPLNKTKKCRR